ncbi:glycosyl hydrolase [Flavobacterium sp.]|uniref:glycosyl hydrolase n=1 Tax=Flavobacterium sp. TaxID=239 RepID=UPI00286AE60E|nr:glycosyl hydrolase [Flavobacterium sp.]
MNKIASFGTLVFLFISLFAKSQTIVWTGVSNSDFFNEANWKDLVTNGVPADNAINPSQNINLVLQINVATTISANGIIQLGTGSLAVGSANLTATSLSGGNITINTEGYVDLTSTSPFQNNVQINFTSGIGWIRTLNYKTTAVSTNNLGQIKVNNSPSVYKTNLHLDNYYLDGCVIRSNIASTTPLTVYDSTNLQGNSASITVNTIHSDNAIGNSMNNKIESFILKKGFMVTFANEMEGIGKSKNYIASEGDLVINTLPKALQNSISFIRVLPWNWVSKKGIGGLITGLDENWYYRWANVGESTVEREYAPMSFGLSGANDASDITLYKGKYKATHVMGYNEPDNCTGQGGTNGGCIIENAVGTYQNLMKTGLRLVSPSCTEGAAFTWLKNFHTRAIELDVRIDVIAVHWYDWGSNPTVNANPTPEQVFNRFKTYLTNVHNLYGLPIWITEFNANPNRTGSVNLEFMKLALPYLESLNYIERYAWFQPSSGVANYFDAGGNYTAAGIYYKNHFSTAAIPELTVNATNNLNLVDYPNVAMNKTATASTTYSPSYLPVNVIDGDKTTSQWILNFGVSGDVNYVPLPAWLEVDLQGSFTIDSFRIIEATKALKNFRFEVWDAALASGSGAWSNVLTVTGNPATPVTTYKTFTPVTTTKVRLYITGHNSLDYMKLLEFEVYGVASATLGVTQFEKNLPFTVYPNPVVNGILNITGNQEVKTVVVYTISGDKINTHFERGQLQVNDLATGVYFLRVNNKYSFKFIKK